MIVDTSALIAILLDEAEAEAFKNSLMTTRHCRLSVVSLVEATIVIERRRGADGERVLNELLVEAQIELMPVTADLAESARRAWRRFGRGNHPAGLNFGDCFVYALAETTGEPLLFKGDDFALTDIQRA